MQTISAGNNYNLLCYSLQRSFDSHELEGRGNSLEHEVKDELNRLMAHIQKTLSEGLPIEPDIDSLIPSIFNLRIKVMKWLIKGNINPETIESHVNDAFNDLHKIGGLEKYFPFTENLKYAITYSLMLARSIFESVESPDEIVEQIEDYNLEYDQAMFAIQLMEPDDKRVNKIFEWTRTAMMMEYFSFALYLIAENKLNIKADVAHNLNEISAKAAQNFVGCLYDLGIVLPFVREVGAPVMEDDDVIKSEQYLSDLGLEEDWENL